jgi:hypothetical protein
MDKVKKYQDLIINCLNEASNFGKPSDGLEHQVIIDREHNHFQLVTTGWQNSSKFVYIVGLHLDIKDGKIWIWQNNLDIMIADELIERGVLRSDIVLAFHSPKERVLSGFAVS